MSGAAPARPGGAKLFFGDAHLDPEHPERTAKVARFLEAIAPRVDEVFVLGDLFDFWFGWKPALFEPYRPVLDALLALRRRGVRFHYLAGNHDFFPGPFFERDLGANVRDREIPVELGGRRGVVVHGDLVNPKDYGYRLLRLVLRSRLAFRVMRALPARALLWIARRMSRASRSYTSGLPPARLEMFRAFAERESARGREFTIMGHFHAPGRLPFEFGGRAHELFVVGDWISQDRYLVYEDGAFALEKFEG